MANSTPQRIRNNQGLQGIASAPYGYPAQPISINTVGSYPGTVMSGPLVETVQPRTTVVMQQPQTVQLPIMEQPNPQGNFMIEIEQERRFRMDLQAQLNIAQAELNAMKARLDRIDPPESPLRAAVRRIEARGNIRVNHETGHVQLLSPLAFHPRTTKDEPTAVLRDPAIADNICRDLSELCQIFKCPMTIEGHTKGGQSDFWQTLANERALLIANKLVEYGANPDLLQTFGLPGKLGKNEVRTEIFMDVQGINENIVGTVTMVAAAPIQEVDIIRASGEIDREFIQGGRVVAEQRIMPSAIIGSQRIGSPTTVLRPAIMM